MRLLIAILLCSLPLVAGDDDDLAQAVKRMTEVFALVQENLADPIDPAEAIYKGLLVGDARFAGYLPPDATTGQRFPTEVLIERPYDRYTLRLTIEPDGIVVNRELPDTAFVLTAPDEWEQTLRRINLDQRIP